MLFSSTCDRQEQGPAPYQIPTVGVTDNMDYSRLLGHNNYERVVPVLFIDVRSAMWCQYLCASTSTISNYAVIKQQETLLLVITMANNYDSAAQQFMILRRRVVRKRCIVLS